ncbi:phosphoribosylformylglycinamidine cyclo-ligase [Candidatus Peregrinibacteria bacterium]|jgi:phosphoribosylformylglycinamidine cyclo-ligase|nr:phosphoribosylformylglycinamidine cyclo-ligase [Candidatus Peregrinibacteria bacterium]MBT5468241.1 phosphoribosylformylglycinamidine cyclo-ligase [Candidatus Peregrinibacteria bacterium]MBT7337089.1 phosphoribosylformylglycinamidine cyclo-ligase [Candidatus Peregrinibacteria bacterium]
MTSYKDSGVDITAGNEASRIAYTHAKSTFDSRSGKIGAPVTDDGGFAGMLDMGDFYLVQNDDGTGSKMELAVLMNNYDTIGYDLLAMVVDDAICTGAEVISISNTLDVGIVDTSVIDSLLAGLAKACIEQKIVIPGGEIAEVPGAVHSPVWNATSVGVVTKDKVITGADIKEGDTIIALKSGVARSNGFSLIRRILLDTQGRNWQNVVWRGQTWGEVMLTPSIIYHGALLKLLGRHGEQRLVNIKGLAHITGGGIAENLKRTLKTSGTGATLTSLFEPHDALKDLIVLGNVPIKEAYNTWNMGNGMLVIVDASDAHTTIAELKKSGIEAQVAGSVTAGPDVSVTAFDGSSITCSS